MTAVEIINEIRHLAPLEKVRVVRYLKTLDDGRPLNGGELIKTFLRPEHAPVGRELP